MTDSPELLHAAGLADIASNRARDLCHALNALAVELRQGNTNPGALLKRIGTVGMTWEDLQLLMRAGRLIVVGKEVKEAPHKEPGNL